MYNIYIFVHCHKYIIIHSILIFFDLFSLHRCLNNSCLNMEPMKQFHELGMVSHFFPRESCRYILPHQTLGGGPMTRGGFVVVVFVLFVFEGWEDSIKRLNLVKIGRSLSR